MTKLDPAGPKLPPSTMEFRWTSRVAAAYLIPVGVAGMWWNYHLVHAKGEYWVKVALLAPALLVMGLFFLFFPDEDPMAEPAVRNLRLRHWLSYLFAFGAAFANWYALSHGMYP